MAQVYGHDLVLGRGPAAAMVARRCSHAGTRETARPASSLSLDFVLFLLLNAVVIVRPSEFVPAIEGLPIYYVVILLCCAASCGRMLRQFRWRNLVEQPTMLCVYGLLVAILLSHLSHGYIGGAVTDGVEFAKILVYFTLLVSVVDSPSRLRQFLLALVVFVTFAAAMAVLQYHGFVNIAALDPLNEGGGYHDTGEAIVFVRLRGVGVFNDPNDLSIILVVAILLCVRGVIDGRTLFHKVRWGGLFAFLCYALALTQSRGGFLAFVVGLFMLFHARFGWRKAVLVSVVGLPLLLLLFGGRQTQISTGTETGQGRLQLWWYASELFIRSPFFGAGAGQMAEYVSFVAHNSFVHAFAELGFFGGTLFIGCFYSGWLGLKQLKPAGDAYSPPEVERLRSYMAAILVAYAAGLMSLSRNYVVPTYLILGIIAAYLRMTPVESGVEGRRSGYRFLVKLGGVSVLFIIGWFAVTRTFVTW